MIMGAGTDYVVTVSNGSTTIQVMDGSVIFIDQYTNNTVTVRSKPDVDASRWSNNWIQPTGPAI